MRLMKRLAVSLVLLAGVAAVAGSVPAGAVEPKCYWVCRESTPCDTPCTLDHEYLTCGEFGICSGESACAEAR